jgi:NAD(P)-dependent dehydrogenase (short-subunit alcohol dehydrogenase family)
MPPRDRQQRLAVVTGAAPGIGRASAARLLTSGAAVCLWDRAPEALTRTAPDLTALGTVEAVTVDVTDPAAVSAAVQATRARGGGIAMLGNNAGIAGPHQPRWAYPLEAWRQVVEVHVLGTFDCCRAVVPVMLQGGYGRIIPSASRAGKEGNPQASASSAAKAGVMGLTTSLGKALARHGMLVHGLTPAAVETDLFQHMTPEHMQYMLARMPMGRFRQPTEIAALVAWLASEGGALAATDEVRSTRLSWSLRPFDSHHVLSLHAHIARPRP